MQKTSTVICIAIIQYLTVLSASAQCFTCADAPPGSFFCDDFESSAPLTDRYFEVNTNGGDLVVQNEIGRVGGRGLRILFQQGEVSAGGLSKSFGKIPAGYLARNGARKDTSFNEIYWRMDVRHQPGWQGNGPAKLSRALVFVNDGWAQGMMAHLWSGGPNNTRLIADPASGIDANGVVKSTKYNDFANLRWLGIYPGTTEMFSDANAGNWYCVVGHVKLNTPGQSNGVFEFWINDTLQQSVTNLNWHGNYNANPSSMTINAVFFESYWNSGSPIQQERYFDNIVIGTKPIPCGCALQTSVENEQHPDESVSVRYFDVLGRELIADEVALSSYVLEVTTQKSGRINTRLITGHARNK
ncbi:MAG: hypothetical protein H7X70_06530 [Candidatus Kapabacteria bacterium]|nr:hypothetical protein [Candidatus Kapabacteria bacterium]